MKESDIIHEELQMNDNTKKTLSKLGLYNYGFLDMEVKNLEMIKESIYDDIDSYRRLLDDDEMDNVEDLRDLVLDLLVATNRNYLQLDRCTDRLRELNNRGLNDSNNRTNENKIKPLFDTEFKKQFIGWR